MNELPRKLTDHLAEVTPTEPPPFRGVLERLARRRHRRTAAVACTVAVVAVSAILVGANLAAAPGRPVPVAESSQPSSTPSPTVEPTPTAAPTYKWGDKPPPVTVYPAGGNLELTPWSYCWTGPPGKDGTSAAICADGSPPADLATVGSPTTLDFTFPMDGWTFEATFKAPGGPCARQITLPVQKTGDQTFQVSPAGPAGDWDVDLFGRGEQGDVITSFHWTTPVDGTLPEPDAYLGVLSSDEEVLHSYGVELSVNDLDHTPKDAAATITLTAANGESMVIEAHRARRQCVSQGQLFFDGPDDPGQQAAQLGPGPITYGVRLVMDGKVYSGRGTWPDGIIKGSEPYVALTFDPPLPAYGG